LQKNIEKLIAATKEGDLEALDSLLSAEKYNINDIFDDKSAVSYLYMHQRFKSSQIFSNIIKCKRES